VGEQVGDLPPFFSARSKIERADQHIRDAQRRIDRFIATECHRPFADKDPDSGAIHLNFWYPGPYAVNGLGVIVGDAVHNLRSALDHMVSEIITIIGGNPNGREAAFPMHETREELEISINRGLEKKIGADLCRFIIETIRPYKAGNFPLWALNKLDNLDKHRAILFGSYDFRSGISFIDENDPGPFPSHHVCVLSNGGPVPEGSAAHLHNQTHAEPTIEIRFKKGYFFDDQPVIPTLLQLAELVGGIVETLSAYFIANRQ
jgi:hypothetical protein